MIAIAEKIDEDRQPAAAADRFEAMLPALEGEIRRQARRLPRSKREELAGEALGLAFKIYVSLERRGRHRFASAKTLAEYGFRQALQGRRVGSASCTQDVLSFHAQRHGNFSVARFGHGSGRQTGVTWDEALVESRKAGPAELAAWRLDFGDWLASLPSRSRAIAETLATGETTKEVAQQFGVSPGRISQVRRELHEAWCQFQGESVSSSNPALAAD